MRTTESALSSTRTVGQTCTHSMWNEPDGLRCVAPAGHPHGHQYVDTTGSSVDDARPEGGHG